MREAIRHECRHVWTTWYYTLLAAHCVHSIPLKGWISAQGHWGVTSGSTVTLSWEINEARAQKGSLRTVHICTNQHCFVTTIFSQLLSDEIRRRKCATFYAPMPEDTQGTGDAGHTLRISEKKDLKNKKECTTWVSERRQSNRISPSHCYYHGWYNVNKEQLWINTHHPKSFPHLSHRCTIYSLSRRLQLAVVSSWLDSVQYMSFFPRVS